MTHSQEEKEEGGGEKRRKKRRKKKKEKEEKGEEEEGNILQSLSPAKLASCLWAADISCKVYQLFTAV